MATFVDKLAATQSIMASSPRVNVLPATPGDSPLEARNLDHMVAVWVLPAFKFLTLILTSRA